MHALSCECQAPMTACSPQLVHSVHRFAACCCYWCCPLSWMRLMVVALAAAAGATCHLSQATPAFSTISGMAAAAAGLTSSDVMLKGRFLT